MRRLKNELRDMLKDFTRDIILDYNTPSSFAHKGKPH